MALRLFSVNLCTGGAPAMTVCPDNFRMEPSTSCDPNSKCSCATVEAVCESYLGITDCFCHAHEAKTPECPNDICALSEPVEEEKKEESPLKAILAAAKGDVLFSQQVCTSGASAASKCPSGYRLNESANCDANSKCSCGSVIAVCEKKDATVDCHCTAVAETGDQCPAEICPMVPHKAVHKQHKQEKVAGAAGRNLNNYTVSPDKPTGTPDKPTLKPARELANGTVSPDKPTGSPDQPTSKPAVQALSDGSNVLSASSFVVVAASLFAVLVQGLLL